VSARSWWKGYVDETSRAQKVVIAVGSIATAVVAIGTAVVSLAGWFGGDDGEGGGGERVRPATAFDGRVIESGTDDGDDLVRFLIAASGGEPVELNLTVLAPGGVAPDPYLPLWYNCAPGAVVGSGACNRVRLEFGSDTPVLTRNPVGWRFRGTYRVLVRNGVDYGTDLDIGFDDIST
jgi:hypothetical protein